MNSYSYCLPVGSIAQKPPAPPAQKSARTVASCKWPKKVHQHQLDCGRVRTLASDAAKGSRECVQGRSSGVSRRSLNNSLTGEKCDLQYPKCSSCVNADVPCLAYHVHRQSEVPRGYVSNLEAQIEQLKKQLSELQEQRSSIRTDINSPELQSCNNSHLSGNSVEDGASDPRDLVKSMAFVVLGGTDQPRFMGSSSGITLAKMVMASVRTHPSVPLPPHIGHGIINTPKNSPSTSVSSLPPRVAADHIVDVYFQHRTSHFPIIEREVVKRAVENVYAPPVPQGQDPGCLDKDLFIVYLIFAIGLCGISAGDVGRPAQSEGCFYSAIQNLEKVLNYSKSDLDILSSILLLAQYVALCPSAGSLWQLIGMALRLCIDLGLHWETENVLGLAPLLLDQRRRLFWTTYNFDRMLSINLGRPFGIADQSLNTAFPDPSLRRPWTQDGSHSIADPESDKQYVRVANHVSRLYRLESEIKHVLYHQLQGTTLAYPRANYTLWLRDIQPQLDQWRATIPGTSKIHPKSIWATDDWWEASYSNALLLLHRPNY